MFKLTEIWPCGKRFCPAATRIAHARDDISITDRAKSVGARVSAFRGRCHTLGIMIIQKPQRKAKPSAKAVREAWLKHDRPQAEIAADLGLEKRAFYVRAKAMGLPRMKTKQATKPWPEDFDAMWKAGVNVREIALLVGCRTGNVVHHAQKVRNLPKRYGTPGWSRKSTITMDQYRALVMARGMPSIKRTAEMEEAARARLDAAMGAGLERRHRQGSGVTG